MTSFNASEERLYGLLPAIYRIRDRAEGEPLRALLAILEQEFKTVERDVEGLYENWFIETCDEWMVPYIGDLLDVRELYAQGGRYGQQERRAYVANTLAYRRRKGTVPVLEQLVQDITGWRSRAVEFFRLLATTQNINHERSQNTTLDLRAGRQPEMLGTPFERQASYTLEVRNSAEGRYNLPTIGLFIWRLSSYVTPLSSARLVCGDRGYTFDPLGFSEPLFNPPKTATDITQLTREINVPAPLRQAALAQELDNLRRRRAIEREIEQQSEASQFSSSQFSSKRAKVQQLKASLTALQSQNPEADRYLNSQRPAFQIYLDGEQLSPECIQIESLIENQQNTHWPARPPIAKAGARVAVDPEKGRLWCFGQRPQSLAVSYAYGFSGDVGSGVYDRRLSIAEAMSGASLVWRVATDNELSEAIAQWNQQVLDWQADQTIDRTLEDNEADAKEIVRAVILLTQSRTYNTSMAVNVPANKQLAIIAANGQRPHILGDIFARGIATAQQNPGTLVLDGLLLEGHLTLLAGHLKQLQIRHCTIAPTVAENPNAIRIDALLSGLNRQESAENNGLDSAVLMALWLYLSLLIRRIVKIGFDSRRSPEQNMGRLWWLAQQQLEAVLNCLQQAFETSSTAGDATLSDLPEYEIFKQAVQQPQLLYDNEALAIILERSISGPLLLAETVPSLIVTGSLVHQGWDEETNSLAVQGNEAIAAIGAHVNIEMTTVFGRTQVRELSASNSLFTDRVWAQLQQSGYVRFCSLPAGSKTPRRFRSQPDQTLANSLDLPLPMSVAALAQQPGTQVMWAATAGSGLYSCNFADQAAEWQAETFPISLGLQEAAEDITALAIAQFPTSPTAPQAEQLTTFLAGTATGKLLVSIGAGESRNWSVQQLIASGQSQTGEIVSKGRLVQGSETAFGTTVKVGDRITVSSQTRTVQQILIEEQQLLLTAPFEPNLTIPTDFSTNIGQSTAAITAILIQHSQIGAQ
ncbi:MAG: hypothetical protein WBA76_09585, partial [Phormidesmis sp.]